MQTAKTLLDAALAKVESASIREWVTSQEDVWLKILAKAAQSKDPEIVDKVAAYIVCTAIGA
jgi:hypothetical protein